MRFIFKTSIALYMFVLGFFPLAHAQILFGDHFDSHPEWDGRTTSVSGLTGETVGNWSTIWHSPQSDLNYGAVSSSFRNGTAGKGFQFKMSTNGGAAPSAAQESCIFAVSSLSQPTLFWGYWYKASKVDWGTGGKILKLTRFYPSAGSSGPSIIPEWYNYEMNVYYNGSNHFTGYRLNDTNWHSHIWEFQRGNNANDGVIRLWADGVLVWSDTAVNWGGTGTNFTFNAFPVMQGNMSGNYNGGDLYTYWDDFVFATTRVEVENFIGVTIGDSTPDTTIDTTAPNVPSGITIQIQ